MDKNEYLTKFYSEEYIRIARFVKSQIYSRSLDDVEDCVQEIFLIALSNMKIKDTGDHPDIEGWLFCIAKNVSAKFNSAYLKNKNNVTSMFDENITKREDDFTYQFDDTDDFYHENNWENIIAGIKKSLPKNERDLFGLKYEKKLSNKEIAVKLNKSEDAIKSKCTKLKKKIKIFIKN